MHGSNVRRAAAPPILHFIPEVREGAVDSSFHVVNREVPLLTWSDDRPPPLLLSMLFLTEDRHYFDISTGM